MTITVRGQGRYELLHGCATTTASDMAVLDGSELDTRAWRSIDYTLSVFTHSADWQTFGDNASNFGAEVAVSASATVASAATGSYTIANAPYQYYRIKVRSTVAGSPADVSLYGLLTG